MSHNELESFRSQERVRAKHSSEDAMALLVAERKRIQRLNAPQSTVERTLSILSDGEWHDRLSLGRNAEYDVRALVKRGHQFATRKKPENNHRVQYRLAK